MYIKGGGRRFILHHPFHLAPQTLAAGCGEPLHVVREEGDSRRNHGKAKGLRMLQAAGDHMKAENSRYGDGRHHCRGSRLSVLRWMVFPHPNSDPRLATGVCVRERGCQARFRSLGLLLSRDWGWEGYAGISLHGEKKSLCRKGCQKQITFFLPC